MFGVDNNNAIVSTNVINVTRVFRKLAFGFHLLENTKTVQNANLSACDFTGFCSFFVRSSFSVQRLRKLPPGTIEKRVKYEKIPTRHYAKPVVAGQNKQHVVIVKTIYITFFASFGIREKHAFSLHEYNSRSRILLQNGFEPQNGGLRIYDFFSHYNENYRF